MNMLVFSPEPDLPCHIYPSLIIAVDVDKVITVDSTVTVEDVVPQGLVDLVIEWTRL